MYDVLFVCFFKSHLLTKTKKVEDFLAEAAQFATDGYVDYRAFAQMMVGEDDS